MDRRKKVLILVGAWLSAAVLAWIFWVNAVAPKTEKTVGVVVAAHDMALGAMLRPADVRLVNYPESDVPKGAVLAVNGALNRVLLVPLSANEPVLLSKISAPTSTEGMASVIEPGYRAVAVPITDVGGDVAGLIQANSRVDVLFTRPGTMDEASTSLILQDVRVLSTGRSTPSGQAVDARTPRSQVVTLMLTPADAQKLELAKHQGRISLSLRNPLDTAQVANDGPLTAEALDPSLDERIAEKRRLRANLAKPGPNLADPKVWEALVAPKPPKKEEKPAVVVDVYHGDKHVQELFK
jgi:Flp pilus assembly protein CpaB